MTPLDRRTFLALGLGSIALGATACGSSAAAPTAPPPLTYSEWAQARQAPYYIAHRGAGTTIPEHSVPGYRKAVEWGAEALELSVVMSSDGILYCHHDLTLNRTTTLTGNTRTTPSSRMDTGKILIPRLGPRWTGDGMPSIPRLDTVLGDVGRKVLCMEAKDDAAFEPMMELLEQRGLLAQVMVKVGYQSRRIAKAKSAGLPVFAYFGVAETVTRKNLIDLAAQLSSTDAIVLPARHTAVDLLNAEAVRHAVDTSVPVWVYPIHRRSEVAYFRSLGVQGFITPALGYLTGQLAVQDRDSFSGRSLAPGLTTRDPYSDWDAVGWDTDDSIELIGNGARSICLGDMSPVPAAASEYHISLEVGLMAGPMANTHAFYLAFGCPDDRYYRDGTPGYRLTLQGDGTLRLDVAPPDGTTRPIGSPASGEALTRGDWTSLTVTVTDQQISVRRDGAEPVSFADSTIRGGYLHVGRTGGEARLAIRSVTVN